MSKIYSLYKDLKNENKNIIYLFKSGIFYIAVSEDAFFLANRFGLKLTKLNDNICKCGFPISSIEKYSKLLKNNSINYKIINLNMDNVNISNEKNNEIKKFINKIANVDTESLSVLEIYRYLDNLKKEAQSLYF